MSDQIGSDSGCDGGGGVTPRNPGSAAVPSPAMRSGLCPRYAGLVILDGHIPPNKDVC